MYAPQFFYLFFVMKAEVVHFPAKTIVSSAALLFTRLFIFGDDYSHTVKFTQLSKLDNRRRKLNLNFSLTL